MQTVLQNLLNLESQKSADSWEPRYRLLSPNAKRQSGEFYNQHAREQDDLDEELSAAWSKLDRCAARLALIVYLARTASADVPDHQEIDVISIEAGIAKSRWFGREINRVYAMLNETEDEELLREAATKPSD